MKITYIIGIKNFKIADTASLNKLSFRMADK